MTSRADINHAMEHFAQGKHSQSRFRGIVENFIRGQRQRREQTQPPGPEQGQQPQFRARGEPQPTRGTADATTAVFTDGSASPNPGPGGWCAVSVQNGTIVGQQCGSEPHTTNNRMELQALIGAFDDPTHSSLDAESQQARRRIHSRDAVDKLERQMGINPGGQTRESPRRSQPARNGLLTDEQMQRSKERIDKATINGVPPGEWKPKTNPKLTVGGHTIEEPHQPPSRCSGYAESRTRTQERAPAGPAR